MAFSIYVVTRSRVTTRQRWTRLLQLNYWLQLKHESKEYNVSLKAQTCDRWRTKGLILTYREREGEAYECRWFGCWGELIDETGISLIEWA
jgi:hypothetical protein